MSPIVAYQHQRFGLMLEEGDFRKVPEFRVYSLLPSPTVTIRDTQWQGSCRSMSLEECTETTQLVFPYRGVSVHTSGRMRSSRKRTK